jgi:RNA polymerase sigma factor (sigma-70 family)
MDVYASPGFFVLGQTLIKPNKSERIDVLAASAQAELRRGEQQSTAFSLLLREIDSRIYRYAKRFGVAIQDTDDFRQEVLVEVLRCLLRYDKTRGGFLTLCYAHLQFTVRDYRRHKYGRKGLRPLELTNMTLPRGLEDAEDDSNFFETVADNASSPLDDAILSDLLQTLGTMTDPEEFNIILDRLSGMPMSEIIKRRGWSPTKFYSKLRTLRVKLERFRRLL